MLPSHDGNGPSKISVDVPTFISGSTFLFKAHANVPLQLKSEKMPCQEGDERFSSPDPQLGSIAHRHSSKLLHTKALLASPLMKCRPISPGFRGHTGLGNRLCPSALLLHITYLQANTTFQLCFLFSGPSNPFFLSAVTYGNSVGLSASMSHHSSQPVPIYQQ